MRYSCNGQVLTGKYKSYGLIFKWEKKMEKNEFNSIGIDGKLDWKRIQKLSVAVYFCCLIPY